MNSTKYNTIFKILGIFIIISLICVVFPIIPLTIFTGGKYTDFSDKEIKETQYISAVICTIFIFTIIGVGIKYMIERRKHKKNIH